MKKVKKILFMIPAQLSIPKFLFSIFVTDEDSYVEYTPRSSYDTTETTTTESTDDELEDSDDDSNEGFSLHMGEILETHYQDKVTKLDYDADYESIENNGSISMMYQSTDLDVTYLGVRCNLQKGWKQPGETLNLTELPEQHKGFITEQSFADDITNLKVSGMTKCLDKKYTFDFTQMKRSDILIEVIKTAGLIPVVDPTGLDDDTIDYSNQSNDDSSDTSGASGANVKALVKKIIKGKNGCIAKAKAIYKWQIANITYSYYPCSHYSSGDECLKNKDHLNCADTSRLTREMLSAAGIKAQVVHGPNHFWTEFTCGSKTYVMDVTDKSRPWNTVYHNLTKDSVCGDEPSC